MAILLQNNFVHFPTIFLLTACYNSRREKAIFDNNVGTTLGCVRFELIGDLSQCGNTITHIHQDMDGSSAMCSLSMSACPINHQLWIYPDIAHSCTCPKPYNNTPHSFDYPTCVKSLHMSRHGFHHNYHNEAQSNEFIDNQNEIMMKDYYSHNQDKMSPAQIRELN